MSESFGRQSLRRGGRVSGAGGHQWGSGACRCRGTDCPRPQGYRHLLKFDSPIETAGCFNPRDFKGVPISRNTPAPGPADPQFQVTLTRFKRITNRTAVANCYCPWRRLRFRVPRRTSMLWPSRKRKACPCKSRSYLDRCPRACLWLDLPRSTRHIEGHTCPGSCRIRLCSPPTRTSKSHPGKCSCKRCCPVGASSVWNRLLRHIREEWLRFDQR